MQIKRKCSKYIEWHVRHFGRVCFIHGRLCDGAMRGQLQFHHEPAKQHGGHDFRGFMLCEPAHTGPKGRHGTGGLMIYAPLMDAWDGKGTFDDRGEPVMPQPVEIKTWLNEQTGVYWPLFLQSMEFHGECPSTDLEMWQIAETLGIAEIYKQRRKSKMGPIKKGPDYSAVYAPRPSDEG